MNESLLGSIGLDEYVQVFKEYTSARAKILALPPKQRLELIKTGLHTHRYAILELAIALDQETIKAILPSLLEIATYITGGTGLARRIVLSLPRVWLVENIGKYAEPLLRNDVDYSGFLSLYTHIDQILALNLARRASIHDDPRIREVGQEYLQEIGQHPQST